MMYDPFGSVLMQAGNNPSGLGFTGEQTDPNGLQYLRARYMNPATGTFLSRDPVEGVMGRVASMNGYGYAEGNPAFYTDPSGQIVWIPLFIAATKIIGAGLVAAGGFAAASVANDIRGGGLISKAGWTGLKAFAAGAAVDIGIGVPWDMVAHQASFGQALFTNSLGIGLGEVIGYGGKRVVRGAYDLLKRGVSSADKLLLRAGSWYANNFDLRAVTVGGLPVSNANEYIEPRGITTVIGSMDDLLTFGRDPWKSGDTIDTWWKSGLRDESGNIRLNDVNWPENQAWLEAKRLRGDEFALATNPAVLPKSTKLRPDPDGIVRIPRGYYTKRELDYLTSKGISVKDWYR
jgi:RHS repeat-associated protein